jgi:hypothetical protein
MSRLNKAVREGIINNALNAAGVITRGEKLIERRAKLADDVRIFARGGVDQMEKDAKAFAKIKKLIGDGVKGYSVDCEAIKDYEIYCNFAGRQIGLHFNGMPHYERELIVYKSPTISGLVPITAENPLNAEFDAVELEQRTIDDLTLTVKAEVGAMVNSVTTIKKLIEIWPEVVALLPAEERSQSTALVADVNRLNTMLDLPKE